MYQQNQMTNSSATDNATRAVKALTVRLVVPRSRNRKTSAVPSAARMPTKAMPMNTFIFANHKRDSLWHRPRRGQ